MDLWRGICKFKCKQWMRMAQEGMQKNEFREIRTNVEIKDAFEPLFTHQEWRLRPVVGTIASNGYVTYEHAGRRYVSMLGKADSKTHDVSVLCKSNSKIVSFYPPLPLHESSKHTIEHAWLVYTVRDKRTRIERVLSFDVTSNVQSCAGPDGQFQTWSCCSLYRYCVNAFSEKDQRRWKDMFDLFQVVGARLEFDCVSEPLTAIDCTACHLNF